MVEKAVVDFFHLFAAVVWIGGMIYAVLVLMPAARGIEPQQRGKLMGAVTRRFTGYAWGSVIILLVTGILKASMENLEKFSRFSQTILWVKYGLFFFMILIGLFITFVLAPRMKSLAPKPGEALPPEFPQIQNRIEKLALTNMILGILVLICVAII